MGFPFVRSTAGLPLTAAFLALLWLSFSLAITSGADKDIQYVKQGRALFVKYCVSCHGTAGRGDGPAALALKTTPVDLTEIAKKNSGFSSDRVANMIDGEKASSAHGSREMPVWGKRFRDAKRGEAAAFGDVYALTKYLKSIQTK